MEPPLCPKCNSTNDVVVILYGEPTPDMLQKAEEGKIALDGRHHGEDSPDWVCRKCGVKFKMD